MQVQPISVLNVTLTDMSLLYNEYIALIHSHQTLQWKIIRHTCNINLDKPDNVYTY